MYNYTFIQGETETEVQGYNLLNACFKLDIKPTRIDKRSVFSLQMTPFNDRVTTLWENNKLYKVKQAKILT